MSKPSTAPQKSPRLTPVAATLALLGALLVHSAEAHAIEGELTLGLGPVFADLPTLGEEGQGGWGGSVYAQYQLTQFWGLQGGATLAYHTSIRRDELPGQRISSVWFGGIYNIDVFTYVPFISFGATAYQAQPQLSDADGNPVDAGFKFGFGVDYRRWRYWSLGFETNLHAFVTDIQTYPVYLTTLMRLNYHWEL